MNKSILIGNLGAAPETIQLVTDRIACRLSVATSRIWKDRESGEKRTETQWHRVIIFEQEAARYAQSSLKKGDLVYIEGKVRTRSWKDGAGGMRSSTEIVLSYNSKLIKLSESPPPNSNMRFKNSTQKISDDIIWSSTGLDDVPF